MRARARPAGHQPAPTRVSLGPEQPPTKTSAGPDAPNPPPTWRCLLSETLGTFALTLVAAGSVMTAALSHGQVDHVAKNLAPGLVVMALIYAFGDVSGAHFNPGVTLAFALRSDFEWRRVPGYWLAQLVGATAAALLLRFLLGPVAHVGTTEPHLSDAKTIALEAVLTALLVTVILNAASRYSLIGTDAAIAVGGTIALCGLFAGTLTGASMNTARTFGPALVAGEYRVLWIYAAGPFAGAIVAVLISMLLHPRRDRQERRAAQGEGSP